MYFSKALFKQSVKANWIKWVAVTASTCIMLAIVIIVLGNLGINDIRDSLKQVFVQADQESSVKEDVVDSYDLYLATLLNYNQNVQFSSYISIITTKYDGKVQQFEQDNEREPNGEEKSQIILEVANEMKPFSSIVGMTEDEMVMLVSSVLNVYIEDTSVKGTDLFDKYFLTQIYQQSYLEVYNREIENGATEEEASITATTKADKSQEIAVDAISQYKQDKETAGTSFQFNIENYYSVATNYVNTFMYENVYQTQIASGEDEEVAKQYAVSVKVISNTALSTYQLWLGEGKTQEEARAEATKSISDQIPEKVAVALSELGNMDIYGLIIGSIFYKIAGLLLPMVFVIMTANGLIAGQVDSGSMAYVLSTPTKRRTVTATQMTYLLVALLAMFSLLTVVSVIAVWIVGGDAFAINFSEILLLNLGAFLSMFAIAGYCFMCSAIFNRSKYSMSIGGGLTIFSLVCTILGLFGSEVVPSAMRISQMNFFNYLSVITLFDTTSILNGSINYLWKFGVLFAIGVVTFIIGVFRFDKKDLPL